MKFPKKTSSNIERFSTPTRRKFLQLLSAALAPKPTLGGSLFNEISDHSPLGETFFSINQIIADYYKGRIIENGVSINQANDLLEASYPGSPKINSSSIEGLSEWLDELRDFGINQLHGSSTGAKLLDSLESLKSGGKINGFYADVEITDLLPIIDPSQEFSLTEIASLRIDKSINYGNGNNAVNFESIGISGEKIVLKGSVWKNEEDTDFSLQFSLERALDLLSSSDEEIIDCVEHNLYPVPTIKTEFQELIDLILSWEIEVTDEVRRRVGELI